MNLQPGLSVTLRRSDPDDSDQIISLIDGKKNMSYYRLYGSQRVIQLIETSYLSITVIEEGSGKIIGFASFEDYPALMKGLQDQKHSNLWEYWFTRMFKVDDKIGLNGMNTLWVSYCVLDQTISDRMQSIVFHKILQTVYSSLSNILGILYMVKSQVTDEDLGNCFEPMRPYFQEVPRKNKNDQTSIQGIGTNPCVYFSSRIMLIPFLEIRRAKQEDHDDLTDVFNGQSETVSEAYGEYFLAELIAAQSESSKALVAQVSDKTIGLMGITDEVDTTLLHECFELDQYDNLLIPELMEAIRKRRDYLTWQSQTGQKEKRIEFATKMKQEKLKCHPIAQRIALQEHLIRNQEEIMKDMEVYLADEAKTKELDRQTVEQMMDTWLKDYTVAQPSQFIIDNPTVDPELLCAIQSEKEFMLSTLEFFGLPKGYMNGVGHFPMWGKEKKDDKQAAARKRAAAKNQKKKAPNAAIAKLKKERGLDKGKDENLRPTHFDITVFKKIFSRFIKCHGQVRSKIRHELLKDIENTHSVFLDHNDEVSWKNCVDVHELALKLVEKEESFEFDDIIIENLGSILLCFGEVDHELRYGERIPPDTEEEKRARFVAEIKAKEAEEAREEAEGSDEKMDESVFKTPAIIQKKPVLMLLRLLSISDLKFGAQRMFEFDQQLFEISNQLQNFDTTEEKAFMSLLSQKQKRKIYEKEVIHTMPPEPHQKYSDDPEIQAVVEQIEDVDQIPNVPEDMKNAFAITLFCVEPAFDCRSADFLQYAFDEYPDREYLIVTQPHTVQESPLLKKFSLPTKKTKNSFQHILYILHRDSLLDQDIQVEMVVKDDLEKCSELTESLDEAKKIQEALHDSILNPISRNYGFVAKVLDEVVGCFVFSKDVNLEYYVSHFHLQDHLLLPEQDRNSHTRLIYSCINPIFEKSTRFILKELLRLTHKKSLYFEVNTGTIIPTIFQELIHIRSRRFPHFLRKKWDHEKYVFEKDAHQLNRNEEFKVDGYQRDPVDEKEAKFSLCFATRRMLSEAKITRNARIVVVGASDTSISFIESLLSTSYLQFTNIVLVAPGGLPHSHYEDKRDNLKAYSTSFTRDELRKIMLESRVRVINARMINVDRGDKQITLHDNTVLTYDTLILGMGIQDKTLNCLSYSSGGINSKGGLKNLDQVVSIDDPHLYQLLKKDGPLINLLTDKKSLMKTCIIYGRTLHTYCCIQGLLKRGVEPQNIILAIPDEHCHVEENYNEIEQLEQDLPFIYQQAFEDENICTKMRKAIEGLGIQIIKGVKLIEIVEDDDNKLESVVFKMLDIPEEVEVEDENAEKKDGKVGSESQGSNSESEFSGTDDEDEELAAFKKKKKKRKKNEREIQCRVLITAGHRDVDQDVFQSIHNNGLVYNGRLIVDRNFQTTDPSIYAAGSLCEFSGRYKALNRGRPLRMDRYNGREIGSRISRSILSIYDPQADQEIVDEELPILFLPQGQSGILPGDIIYYHIKTSHPLILQHGDSTLQKKHLEKNNRPSLICDNLNLETGEGYLIKFSFNNIGLIDAVTYMGSEEIVLQSLWSFVGMHENYLNSLTSRFDSGIIPNVVEFLSENWAIALYHEWFTDFCLRMRESNQQMADIQVILEEAFELTKSGKGISREQLQELSKNMGTKSARMIKDETLEFIKTNMNHLPMYYVPDREFK